MSKEKEKRQGKNEVLHVAYVLDIYLSHAACEVEKQSAPKAKKQEKDTVKTLPKKKRGKLPGLYLLGFVAL